MRFAAGRIRTHNRQTTDGKAFVLFAALVIRTYMLGKLKKHLADKSASLKKIINRLTNITVIAGGGEVRLTKALTKIDLLCLQCN